MLLILIKLRLQQIQQMFLVLDFGLCLLCFPLYAKLDDSLALNTGMKLILLYVMKFSLSYRLSMAYSVQPSKPSMLCVLFPFVGNRGPLEWTFTRMSAMAWEVQLSPTLGGRNHLLAVPRASIKAPDPKQLCWTSASGRRTVP